MGARWFRPTSRLVLILTALMAWAGTRPAKAQEPAPFDLLITNGRVMDGTGNPWRRADIGVRDGRIAAIGRLDGAEAARRIDAGARVVTPGFIDVHSHAGVGLARAGLGHGQPLLAQGVTTIVANPDGGGPVDLDDQRASLVANGLGVNVALLIGHAGVRRAVLEMADRAPTEDEMAEMQRLVRRGMEAGAYGLSSGLFYAPGSYATTEELVALGSVVAEFGGLYSSHIRDESNYTVGLVAAVNEVIRIAEANGITGIVSHMKALGPDNWGLSVAATTRLDEARRRGVEVYADQYPYAASSTGLSAALVPRWAQAGGADELARRVAEPETRAQIVAEMRENLRRRGGPEAIVVAFHRPDPTLEGQSLAEIATARGQPPVETALDLIGRGRVSIISFNMSERDIAHIMQRPYTMTSSDGGLVPLGDGRPHPRNYGAFARKLARYTREREVVPLEFAVRSMTSLPAAVFGLIDRGTLRVGAWADLLIFNPADVEDRATYTDPHQLAVGFDTVIVNGTIVREDGRFTDARSGRVLRKRGNR